MKRIHDNHVQHRTLEASGQVLLYNSWLRLFSEKLKSRWTTPYIAVEAYLLGAVMIRFDDEDFLVNGARLKKYCPSIPIHAFGKPEEDILVSDLSQIKDEEGEN